MPRKTPKRPDNDISQRFNDGILTVNRVENRAPDGYQPRAELTEIVKLPYEEQRVGISRYYEARQNQIKIEKVLRVPDCGIELNNQQIVKTGSGDLYRIDFVQKVDVFPPSLDLTLVKFEQKERKYGGNALV